MPKAKTLQGGNTVRQKAKKQHKITLCTPYTLKWPYVEEEVENTILNTLKETLLSYKLKPPELSRHLKREEREKLRLAAIAEKSSQDRNLMRQLCKGAGSVTRAMEQDKLRLCVIDRSAPGQLHKHLIQLSAVRRCAAVAVRNLSAHISDCLGLTSCAVLAFKKLEQADDPGFSACINKITPLIPPLDAVLPWLHQTEAENGSEAQLDNEAPQDADDNVVVGEKTSENSHIVAQVENNNVKEDTEDLSASDDSVGKISAKDKETDKETKKDYSHLYIYKKDLEKLKRAKSFGEDFISFGSDNESDCSVEIKQGLADLPEMGESREILGENGVKHKGKKGKKRKHNWERNVLSKGAKKTKFMKPNLGKVQPRPDKKKKKK